MKNKKLGIALLTLAVFTTTQTKNREGVYQPKTPWPLAPIEDVVVGTAGVLTFGQTDANPSALPMALPDAIPGVSAARANKSSDSESTPKKRRVRKEKTSKESTPKKTRKAKTVKDNAGKVITAPVVVPAAVVADVVTLDTQHFTTRAVDSINDDSAE